MCWSRDFGLRHCILLGKHLHDTVDEDLEVFNPALNNAAWDLGQTDRLLHLLHLGVLVFRGGGVAKVAFLGQVGGVQDFNLGDLAECLFSLPMAYVALIIVQTEVFEKKHLLSAVRGNEPSQQVTMHG